MLKKHSHFIAKNVRFNILLQNQSDVFPGLLYISILVKPVGHVSLDQKDTSLGPAADGASPPLKWLYYLTMFD